MRRGTPWFYISICVAAFGCVIISTPVIAQEKTEEQSKAEAAERELKRRDEAQQRDARRRLFTQVTTKVERTTEFYVTLAKNLEDFSARMKALLTNEEGKRLAHNSGFVEYIELEKYPAALPEEVQTRRASAESILKSLKAEEQRVDIGFLPSEATIDEADELYFWVKDRLGRLAAQEVRLQGILSKAPTEIDLSKARTLVDTITDYHATWSELLNNSRLLGEQLSKPESEKILVDAVRIAELERARLASEGLVREKLAEMETMKVEFEARLSRMATEQEALRLKAKQESDDAKAELEALHKDADTARLTKTIDADVAREAKTADAERKLLVQRCHSAEVKRLLAPLLSQGYYQPGVKGRGIERKSVSLTCLRRFGALEKNKNGLAQLLAVGVGKDNGGNRRFNDRPTLWGWYHDIDRISVGQLEELKKAQLTLIELGDTLVEERMLAP